MSSSEISRSQSITHTKHYRFPDKIGSRTFQPCEGHSSATSTKPYSRNRSHVLLHSLRMRATLSVDFGLAFQNNNRLCSSGGRDYYCSPMGGLCLLCPGSLFNQLEYRTFTYRWSPQPSPFANEKLLLHKLRKTLAQQVI